MGGFLQDLVLGEPLALVKKLPCFDNLIELYVLLVGALQLGVHDLVHCSLLNAVGVELCRVQVPCPLQDEKYSRSNSTLKIVCKSRKGGRFNSKAFSPTTLVMVYKAHL
jgi:hypothetical protein